ncbi:MAG: hypothetical protein L0H96_03250 [Humibacillus sp.]|nr:hypothetical protein [Humibacillus sp.]MDN5775909.1 hypothetical protein [Humibacillus sp.]
MAAAAHLTLADLIDRGMPFWLPPGGRGNGLTDHAWAQLLDVRSEVAADEILLELNHAGVPGYAARVHQPPQQALRHSKTEAVRLRIWVGCSAYGRAEITIMRILPNLVKRLGTQILS